MEVSVYNLMRDITEENYYQIKDQSLGVIGYNDEYIPEDVLSLLKN